MVVDVCTFNGEQELWEIHYGVLKPYVDEFVVLEFDKTFSGQVKAPSFPVSKYPEVKYHFVGEETYSKYKELAESSPNTYGADHWKREFCQKESIKDYLTHLDDEDTVFIGDVDEVWEPSFKKRRANRPIKLRFRVYTYWLNNRSTERFNGTLVAKYKSIRRDCLNHLRSDSGSTFKEYGWHFTSMGGPKRLTKKLTDSYTQESYATPLVLENVAYNIESNKDFLGRDFTYTIDESEWPGYLRGNREKYKHLMK